MADDFKLNKDLEDVLKKYGRVPEQKIDEELKKLGDSLFGSEWGYVDKLTSEIAANDDGDCKVLIAHDWLTYGCPEGYYNLAGYVITVQQMFHEKQHLQQYGEEWYKKPSRNPSPEEEAMTDIIRRYLIKNFVGSSYTHHYDKDPGEIDAELCGMEHAVSYFKGNVVVAPETAMAVLHEVMTSDSYGHKEQLAAYDTGTYVDMVNAFRSYKNIAIHEDYPITTEKPPFEGIKSYKLTAYDMTKAILNDDKYEPYRNELAKYKDGKAKDKLLEQLIVLEHPDVIRCVPRLRDELNKCRMQVFMRKIEGKMTGKDPVIPASKQLYANAVGNQKQEDDDYSTDEQYSEDYIADFTDKVNSMFDAEHAIDR